MDANQQAEQIKRDATTLAAKCSALRKAQDDVRTCRHNLKVAEEHAAKLRKDYDATVKAHTEALFVHPIPETNG